MSQISSYEVTVAGKPEWGMIINASTAAKAKHEYHTHLLDAWPDIPWTALRCRKLGAPHTSERFIQNAAYRARGSAKCGSRVNVGGNTGTIVGHDCNCNFEVEFYADSKYKGARLSVHPSEMEIL
jgi:hypothetical protein